ncbi:MAG: MFS transporter, partial [Parachlamydia sp.]|nr:MFS transporter [Parachlamydia sp.]
FGNNVMAALVKEIGWQCTMYGSAVFGLLLTGIIWVYVRNGSPPKKKESAEVKLKILFTDIFKLLKKPQMWLIAFIGGVLYTSLSVFAELWSDPYLQQAKGFTPQMAAALTSTIFLGWAIGGPIVGFISDYFNNRRTPIVLGSVLGAISIAALIYMDGLSPLSIGAILFLFGVFSSAENITFVIAKECTSPALTGSAVALTNMFVMLPGAILQPLVGYMLDLTWDGTVVDAINHYSNSSFQYALLVLPATYLLAGGLSLFLKKSYATEEKPASEQLAPAQI